MRPCPGCAAELSEGEGHCPRCGQPAAPAPVWKIVFRTPESLQKYFDRHLAQHRMAVPRGEPVAPGGVVRLRIVLPEEAGEVSLTGRVVETLERSGRPKAPYDVKLELIDLTADQWEALISAAHPEAGPATSRPAPPAARPAPPAARPDAPRPGANGDLDLDAQVKALVQPREVPPAPETPETGAEAPAPDPTASREPLPEEIAKELTDFTLELVRAVTKSSYYTADHQEAGKAKLGLYGAFTALVADRPEVTFYARKTGEKSSILVYGIFVEPTDLSKAMLKGTADLYIPKLAHYFEANGLVSISFKPELSEEEFHHLVDLLASPTSLAPGAENGIVKRLAENRIHHISVVVAEDRISGRGLSWRVEMALTRLRKDLSVIPLYEHLNEEELRRVRLQVFRDVVRPLRGVELIRELLENCDRVIEQVEEFSDDQLAEIEHQVLASVPEASLPALLEGLVADVAEAKRESEARMDRLLRLTRRVAQQLRSEQAKNLVDAFRILLQKEVLALDELPEFLRRKFSLERDADAFLELRERIFARFEAETDADEYQNYLGFFESIFPELLSRADPSATIEIVERVSEHRTSEPPFEGRPECAATWVERIIYESLAGDLVRELSRADKLKRESLLDLCRRLGDETVPTLFQALAGCANVPTRSALTEVLSDLKYASLAFLRSELAKPDLPVEYLLELLHILASVGTPDSKGLLTSLLGHANPVVRTAALETAVALDPEYGEKRVLAALSDANPKVQEAALKGLFERGCTAPELFAFCGRVLGDPDESQARMARLVCSRLAGCEQGETRERAVAALLVPLEQTPEEKGGRLWSSLKRSVGSDAKPPEAALAACQALGRLRATEATDALERVSQNAPPALRRAAQQALERIRSD